MFAEHSVVGPWETVSPRLTKYPYVNTLELAGAAQLGTRSLRSMLHSVLFNFYASYP